MSSKFEVITLAGSFQLGSFEARKVMLPPYDPSDSGARPSKTSWSIRKIFRPSASDSTVKDSASMPSGFNRARASRRPSIV